MREESVLQRGMELLAVLPSLRRMDPSNDIACGKVAEIESFLRGSFDDMTVYEFLTAGLQVDLRTVGQLSEPMLLGRLLNCAHEDGDRFLVVDTEIYHSGDRWAITITVYRKLLERLCLALIAQQSFMNNDNSSKRRELQAQIRLSILKDYQSLGVRSIPPIKLRNTRTGASRILESIPLEETISPRTLANYNEQSELLDSIKRDRGFLQARDAIEELASWAKKEPSLDAKLPSPHETVAISRKPKMASLCYDRLWAPLTNIVPEPIRCWGGTSSEYIAVISYMALYQKWLSERAGAGEVGAAHAFEQALYEAMVPVIKSSPMTLEYVGTVNSPEQLKASLDTLMRHAAVAFSQAHGVAMVPIYESAIERDRAYELGDRRIVVSVLSDLRVVDEDKLSWEQVLEFRRDEDTRKKYRRFLHWLDTDMVGRAQASVEDEISHRLEDYEWALKKHGIKCVLGTIEEALDGKYILGASGFALAGHPVLGALTVGLLVAGKMTVKLLQVRLDYDDVEQGANSEISWVYEAKGLTK